MNEIPAQVHLGFSQGSMSCEAGGVLIWIEDEFGRHIGELRMPRDAWGDLASGRIVRAARWRTVGT